MRTSEVFVLGAITGAVVTWLWGRKIADYVGEQTRGVRAAAAEGMRAVDEKAGQVVSEALRAGEEAIRPAPTTRGA
ncbi:MAG TPA: hypothetical protein VHM29_08595 [Acidimicrobiia bacterium]|jgi:hypothetical protein|nr:hypothetical protein [Acidimicrobiia bacterium]